MKKENPKYPGIYLAENIIDYHGQIGIIRLSFPRCFIWFDQDADSIYCSYDEFKDRIAHINWLDPSNSGSNNVFSKVYTLLKTLLITMAR